MKKKLAIPALIVVGLLVVWGLAGRSRGAGTAYRFVELERGQVESVVSSTGTLQAITTVEVGTQVSGKIEEIYVDFNDRVREGQLIARIDPTLLEQEVRAAEASLERSEAERRHTQRELARMQQLYDRKVITESEYNSAEYQHAVAQAAYKSAEINLERARRNLNYTEIRAPIEGVVLNREVDVGQTVAASFSAPLLFLIAEDLSKMEILTSVDESDIGQIHEGQQVRFTVQAYPDEPFSGTVGQVRLQSSTQENVVNYTVVVAVENPDGRLLPGMTATVEFIIAQATDVLRVANSALRFRPSDEMWAALRERRGGETDRRSRTGEAGVAGEPGARVSGVAVGPQSGRESGRAEGGPSSQGQTGGAGTRALLWYVDVDGKVNAAPVQTGVSGDQYTEVEGSGIQEGMQIIAAITTTAASSTVNPFEGQQTRGFRRRPPGM